MRAVMPDLSGETIVTMSGRKYKLNKLAGYGAQGVVYEDDTGKKMIKFYYPTGEKSIDSEIIDRLHYIRNIKKPPNFVDIEDIIEKPYVGYVMTRIVDYKPLNTYLIPDRNVSFAEWYNSGKGLRERIFIAYIIAKAFGALERINLSYCDISGDNILVKIGKNAAVKIIDVDNLYVAGKGIAAVLGTPRYIAPEVMSRQKNPDVLSDNYSLAVIVFELLRVGHPYISDDILDGTPADEEDALAGKREYVTDDNSKNMLPADVVLTEKLKNLFQRCFVDGKENRLMRPSAQEFEFALLEASNKVIRCRSCGAWHYPRKIGRVYIKCPWCDAPSKPEAKLNFYDALREGESYEKRNVIENKFINTYILREEKNKIKNLYVFRSDDPLKATENHMTIAKNAEGYHAYNEFSKDGIIIRKYRTGKTHPLEKNTAEKLESGDEIYFETNATIKFGGKQYSLIRMARFVEETL